jgi:hypothetical protein
MNKRAVRGYDPNIGQLSVHFTDYFRDLQENCEELEAEVPCDITIEEAFKAFSDDKRLSNVQVYDLAQHLASQGWEIDPNKFAQGQEGEIVEETLRSPGVFNQYLNALRLEDYDLAHQIYESMTPTQQQVIKDRSRRGGMANNLRKLAQETDAEAVLEKEVPAELVKPVDQEESELIEKAQVLIDSYHQMMLPSESMSVFLPFGASLDELKRARLGDDKAETYKRLEDFLSWYGKALNYLKQQGYNVEEDLNMIKKYADNQIGVSSKAIAARKVLALASNLQAKGKSDIARRLLKVIRAESEWETTYRDLLSVGDYGAARDLYLNLDPVDRKKADEIGKIYHSANTFIRLRDIGQKLFDKGRYVEATKIDRMIKGQFIELPQELQHQVILLIVPEGEQLPQAFKSTEDAEKNTKMMEERVTDMKGRLMPENVCNPHCANVIPRLLKLADKLDAEGKTEEATRLDNWLKKIAYPGEEAEDLLELSEEFGWTPKKKRRDVQQGKCPGCGVDVFFDPIAEGGPGAGAPPCPHCKKDPWGYGRRANLKYNLDLVPRKWAAKDDNDHGGKPAKVVEIADAIRRDNPDTSDEVAYRMAWETYCSYTNRNHPGCTEKGKSMRKSPKPYEKVAQTFEEYQEEIEKKKNKQDLPSGEFLRRDLKYDFIPERTWKKHRKTQYKPKEASHKCSECNSTQSKPNAVQETYDKAQQAIEKGKETLQKGRKSKEKAEGWLTKEF